MQRFGYGFLKTVIPSLMVSRTAMSLMLVVSTFKGFLSRITRSASLPASKVPLEFSSLIWKAAMAVTARSAW